MARTGSGSGGTLVTTQPVCANRAGGHRDSAAVPVAEPRTLPRLPEPGPPGTASRPALVPPDMGTATRPAQQHRHRPHPGETPLLPPDSIPLAPSHPCSPLCPPRSPRPCYLRSAAGSGRGWAWPAAVAPGGPAASSSWCHQPLPLAAHPRVGVVPWWGHTWGPPAGRGAGAGGQQGRGIPGAPCPWHSPAPGRGGGSRVQRGGRRNGRAARGQASWRRAAWSGGRRRGRRGGLSPAAVPWVMGWGVRSGVLAAPG